MGITAPKKLPELPHAERELHIFALRVPLEECGKPPGSEYLSTEGHCAPWQQVYLPRSMKLFRTCTRDRRGGRIALARLALRDQPKNETDPPAETNWPIELVVDRTAYTAYHFIGVGSQHTRNCSKVPRIRLTVVIQEAYNLTLGCIDPSVSLAGESAWSPDVSKREHRLASGDPRSECHLGPGVRAGINDKDLFGMVTNNAQCLHESEQNLRPQVRRNNQADPK
jgi:hypothetical protein